MQGAHGFILNWTFRKFSDFHEKNRYKKEGCKSCFDEREKPWTYLKIFWKKTQSHLNSFRLASVNHGGRYFFENLLSHSS